MSEPSGPTSNSLYRWGPETQGWSAVDLALRGFTFHDRTFDGVVGAVPAFVEPGPEDIWVSPGAIEVTADGLTWTRRLIEQSPVSEADHYLSRTASVVDAGVVDGRIYVVMDEQTLFDRHRFVADRELGDYTDWDVHDGVIRMWATYDNPDGPYRGKRPAVLLPLSEADLSPGEYEVLEAQTDGRFDAHRRVRVLWSDDGEEFVESEIEPLIANEPPRLLITDRLTGVALSTSDGGVLLISDDDGRSYRRASLPSGIDRLDPYAVITDGSRFVMTDTEDRPATLHLSSPDVDGWVEADAFPPGGFVVAAGPVGIAAISWTGGGVVLHFTPDGVNWVEASAQELFGQPGNVRVVAGEHQFLVVFEPENDPHQPQALIGTPGW